VLFVGYGSLLSARGLGPQLPGIADARLLWLDAPRRFGKPPQKGGRLAMEVVGERAAYTGAVIDPAEGPRPRGAGCGAILLEVRHEGVDGLARREGFDPACWARLRQRAGARDPAEFLLELAGETGDDPLAYRARLWELVWPTSWSAAHYLPHPVALEDGRAALVFVAPEVDETGHPELPSCKAAFPELAPALLDRLYEVGHRGVRDWSADKQDHYVELCLLGLAHGIPLADLAGEALPPDHRTRTLLRTWRDDPSALRAERAALRSGLRALGSVEAYAARFAPDLETAWRWSGLLELL